MAIEIERKFLVADDSWQADAKPGKPMRQGYIARGDGLNVRVRLVGNQKGFLTLKAARSGISRQEFEYEIPASDAEALLALAQGSIIEKVRYLVPFAGREWEVDRFAGDNEGLVTAELELDTEDEAFASPPWLGREVTDERRYYNAALASHPFRHWSGETT